MEAKIRCKIKAVDQDPVDEKMVLIKFQQVEGVTVLADGRKLPCSFEGEISIKQVVADDIKIGSVFVLNIVNE